VRTIPHRRGAVARAIGLATTLAVVLGLAACSSSPYTSFDPAGPCTVDGRFPGAYPALEAMVPTTYFGRGPDTLDSGRNCSVAELGTLAGHGLTEVRFAGGTWNTSANSGVTLAVFTGDGLTAEWLGEWYEASARAATNTRQITPSRPSVAGRQGYRLDTINGDSNQSVTTWPSAKADVIYVVLAADTSPSDIQAAIEAFPTGT
jgi:hypothetical protein